MRTASILASVFLVLILGLAACGGNDNDASGNSGSDNSAAAMAGDPEAGEQVYQSTCVACHGADATGVAGLGKSLYSSASEFIRGKSDEELVAFLKEGRQPDSPLNTTGVAMPPKGGNPALGEEDLYHVVAFIRTLE